ncbi:hypothetical protein [Psychroserpens sp.]|uniref:DUF7672 family protein n=1 Tax=Psychroserpens sp. TaxID=2020870 RepID=UPI001B0A7C84|nr:hypothetical protein [Psychroserpens sp.]MBO6606089.1 hypothetical protein [Psychroserpens sp.]MBO6631309.1 hypothetical protein [Psychroserpens sp.]MBO6652540.1 hypothetical protein [Psychroserpens sp.]MBO6681688.1 hypothetical protein [Psychroserpens sp.]MBO6749463.1 hypothetical protein [Psychroserpens sp.]
MIRLYIIGICILIIAIVANGIVLKLGLKTWYDFIGLLNDFGLSAFSKIGIFDYLWLFILYPFVLALGYVIGNKLYSFWS